MVSMVTIYQFVFDFRKLFIGCAVRNCFFLEMGPVREKSWPNSIGGDGTDAF